MRVGANTAGINNTRARQDFSVTRGRRFGDNEYAEAMAVAGSSALSRADSRLWQLSEEKENKEKSTGYTVLTDQADEDGAGGDRAEATRVYEAVTAGKDPLEGLRQVAKVPYGYLAKDGVIEYNGICFICDEKTNSICLGDMTDKTKVLNIPLSGGGCLKVNRANLGDLSKAIGMFSPEDVNRILRAIAQDTKIQSMKNELEDMEASVGEELRSDTQKTDEE